MLITPDRLILAMNALNYRVFTGEMNLNLIGIRSADTEANSFNDVFCVLYQVNGDWVLEPFDCTTDPGTYYRENPINVAGTAIVAPAQHRGVWTFGLHQGQYEALVQNKAIAVYRDNNQDNQLDTDGAIVRGFYGINCHRAGRHHRSVVVDKWSAGCQVIAAPRDFERLLQLCHRSAVRYGPTFTYTLLTQEQLENPRG